MSYWFRLEMGKCECVTHLDFCRTPWLVVHLLGSSKMVVSGTPKAGAEGRYSSSRGLNTSCFTLGSPDALLYAAICAKAPGHGVDEDFFPRAHNSANRDGMAADQSVPRTRNVRYNQFSSMLCAIRARFQALKGSEH